MKKNVTYIQSAILNELMKEYTTRDIADAALIYLNKSTDADLCVYDTHDDSITFRRNKDTPVMNNDILKALNKGIQDIINEYEDLPDILSDIYDCKYNAKHLSISYLADIINIKPSGRLIHVEIDIH